MKKLLIAATAVLAMAAPAAAATPSATIARSDSTAGAYGDSVTFATTYSHVANKYTRIVTVVCVQGDRNGDGRVDFSDWSADAVYIRQAEPSHVFVVGVDNNYPEWTGTATCVARAEYYGFQGSRSVVVTLAETQPWLSQGLPA